MPVFLLEHLDGCTPLQPCVSCRAAAFLKEKLSEADFKLLLEMAYGSKDRLSDDTKIDNIDGLSIRTRNCLMAENLNTVAEVVNKTETQLLMTPNFGRRSLNELKEVLARGGRTLAKAPSV